MEVGVGSYVHIPLIIRNETADSCRVTLTPELPGGWKRGAGAGHYPLSPHEVFAAQTFVFAPKDPDADFRNIVWKADVNGKLIGSVTIRVRVLEWALPE